MPLHDWLTDEPFLSEAGSVAQEVGRFLERIQMVMGICL